MIKIVINIYCILLYLNKDIQFNSIVFLVIVKPDKFQMRLLESDSKNGFFEKYFKIPREKPVIVTFSNVTGNKLGNTAFARVLTFSRMMMMMMMMMIMMIMMMNCFCGMVGRWKAFSLISSRDHYQRSSPSRISDTPRAGFEPPQNLSSGLVEWSCAVVITTTSRRHGVRLFNLLHLFSNSLKKTQGWN